MAGSYRPRPAETRTCSHCGTQFQTRHKRTMYCGSSCRTLAYNLRHQEDQLASSKAIKGELSLSTQNIGVTAAGAAVAAVGNYVFNDRPAQKDIIERLQQLEKGFKEGLNKLISAEQYQVDFINAMTKIQPGLGFELSQIIEKRKAEMARRLEEKQKGAKALIAKRQIK